MYSAIRHTTKTGKLSSNWNIVNDLDGSHVTRCTSKTQALSLLYTLNNTEAFYESFHDSSSRGAATPSERQQESLTTDTSNLLVSNSNRGGATRELQDERSKHNQRSSVSRERSEYSSSCNLLDERSRNYAERLQTQAIQHRSESIQHRSESIQHRSESIQHKRNASQHKRNASQHKRDAIQHGLNAEYLDSLGRKYFGEQYLSIERHRIASQNQIPQQLNNESYDSSYTTINVDCSVGSTTNFGLCPERHLQSNGQNSRLDKDQLKVTSASDQSLNIQLNNEQNSTSDRNLPVRPECTSVNHQSNTSNGGCNGSTQRASNSYSYVNPESTGITICDQHNEKQKRAKQALESRRKENQKSGFPLPRQFSELSRSIKNGVEFQHNLVIDQHNLVIDQHNLVNGVCQIAEVAIGLAASSFGIDVGTIDSRNSTGVHQSTREVEPETIDVTPN
jgi:hypothetical protein